MLSTSHKTATKAGVTAIAALAIVGAIGSAASAKALTYTVKTATTTSGTATFTSAANGSLSFADITTGLSAVCSSSTTSGSAKLSAKAKGKALASVTNQKFTGCKANGELDLGVTPSGTWTLTGTGATSGGVTPGTLTKISAAVKDTDGFGCSFTIAGTVDASYNNTGTLSLAPASGTKNYLLISKQAGNCLGLANNGDKVTVSGSYKVTSSPAGLSITSN